MDEILEQAALREVREETGYDGEAVEQFENPEDQEGAHQAHQALYHFAVQTFMGTQMLWSPGKTLKDFRPAA